MPKTRRYVKRRRSRKKRWTKRRSLRNTYNSAPAGMLGSRFIKKFKYVDRINLNPGIAITAHHTFRANSLFDPDFTGLGHQPIGFDQFMQFYDHFCVLGAKIVVKFVARTNTVLGNAIVGIQLTDSNVAETLTPSAYEQGNINWRILTNDQSNGTITVSKTFSGKKFFGKKNLTDSDKMHGTSSSNPLEDACFQVFATGINDTEDPGSIDAIVTIHYTALLSEPRDIPTS